MDERSIEDTGEITGSTVGLEDIARKLATLAEEIRSMAAVPLEDVAVEIEHDDMPPEAAAD
ncbi:hypothetical protein [Ensifer sp.]|uniref:hypothetical protein n=1 Tax=Ensifer sp. TaxID=1872086 RepID=UPI002E0D960B|nr:hypothetical protein [Ensifer sp.]